MGISIIRSPWNLIKNFLGSVKRLLDHFSKNDIIKAFVIIILCLSVALILALVDKLNISKNAQVIFVCKKFSEVIIAGGFFAIILKALRLSNFFEEDLADVIYGKQFLSNTTDEFKERAWKNVTESLYESKFPDLSAKINTRIFNEIIPHDLYRHHKEIESYLTIKKLDADHIEIKHIDQFVIVTPAKTTTINSEYVIDGSLSSNNMNDLRAKLFPQTMAVKTGS